MKYRFKAPKHLNLFLFGIFFSYACIIAILVQFVVLPYFLPSVHLGNGIFHGGDTGRFHNEGVEGAAIIREHGWHGVMEVLQFHQAPARILSILYYLVGDHFYATIPINALCHALSGLIILQILLRITQSPFMAAMGSLPFVFLPSSILWYTQFHKDGLYILGILLFFWSLVARFNTKPVTELLARSVIGIWGLLLASYMRPYIVDPMILLIVIIALVILVGAIFTKNLSTERSRLTLIGILLAFIFTFKPQSHICNLVTQVEHSIYKYIISLGEGEFIESGVQSNIDKTMSAVLEVRKGFADSSRYATTNVDVQIIPKDFPSAVAFMPKAFLNSFFAPFPNQWFQKGNNEVRTHLKLLVMFEMIFEYITLIFALIYCVKNYRNKDLQYIMIGCVQFIWMLGFLVPNVGTLMRFRYSFMCIIVGLGFATLCSYLNAYVLKKNPKPAH